MESRSAERYNPSLSKGGRFGQERYTFQFSLGDNSVKGVITDISLKGLGCVISEGGSVIREALTESDDLYITISAGDDKIMAGVTMVWIMEEPEIGNALRAGFEFSILSSEDRSRIYSIVKRIRENNAF